MIQNIKSFNSQSKSFVSGRANNASSIYNSRAQTVVNSPKKKASDFDPASAFERFGKSAAKLLRWITENFFGILIRAAVLLIPIAVIFKVFGGKLGAVTSSSGIKSKITNAWNEFRGRTPSPTGVGPRRRVARP